MSLAGPWIKSIKIARQNRGIDNNNIYVLLFYSHPHLKTTVWTEGFAKDCIGSDHCTPAAEF